ncbi:MAG TPA: FkbM family methyltransferase [Gemmatimonadaceae bacterium]|nr:FkbM family methyltransferase [Gemmatimonadaceae bacterium]
MKLKKLAAVTLNRLFRNHTYTVRHGLAKGLKRRGGLAFLPAVLTAVPKRVEEEGFLSRLALDGQTVFDVGGDQGIYTLFFASRVGERGRVVTFEPNPESHQRIVANVELNAFRNVDVRRHGLGAAKGTLSFVFPAGDPARGSGDSRIQAQILREKDARAIEIEVESLDSLLAASALPQPDLVKIDVEGLEMDVLRGMTETLRKRRPDLFIEVHGADPQSKEDNARHVVNLLLDAKYSVLHVESKQSVTRANIEAARRGHLYCEPQRD